MPTSNDKQLGSTSERWGADSSTPANAVYKGALTSNNGGAGVAKNRTPSATTSFSDPAHPNANVDDNDVGTGIVDLSRKMTGGTRPSTEKVGSADPATRAATKMGGDGDALLGTDTTNTYLSNLRQGGRCSTQLGGYERCMEANKGDYKQCTQEWDDFLYCKEGSLHSVV